MKLIAMLSVTLLLACTPVRAEPALSFPVNYLHESRPYVCDLPRPYMIDAATVPKKFWPRIREGFEFWNRLAGRPLWRHGGIVDTSLGIVDRTRGTVVLMYRDDDRTDRCGTCPWYPRGNCIQSAIHIHLRAPCVAGAKFDTLMRHEIGHAMGLGHVDGALMAAQLANKGHPRPVSIQTVYTLFLLYPAE